jgi:hypothetical protein
VINAGTREVEGSNTTSSASTCSIDASSTAVGFDCTSTVGSSGVGANSIVTGSIASDVSPGAAAAC